MSKHLPSIKIDIWSDVACPWCYLGKRRLDLAVASFRQSPEALPVEIEYHSYQLNPDLPADYEGDHSEYLRSRLGMSSEQIASSNRTLAEMGKAVGAEYRMDRVVISNTAKANELLQFAKAHGKQAELKERLFQAYWTEGRHLGRAEDLVELAGDVGLDREAARRSLTAGEFAGAVRADLKQAQQYGIRGVPFFVLDREAARRSLTAGEFAGAVRADLKQAQQYGIRGVPFFVLDRKYGLSGAQEPETFLNALEALTKQKRGAV